jgi:hypothetical protein
LVDPLKRVHRHSVRASVVSSPQDPFPP